MMQIEAAWLRMKDFLFIQDTPIETRPLSQEQMKFILTESLKDYNNFLTNKE